MLNSLSSRLKHLSTSSNYRGKTLSQLITIALNDYLSSVRDPEITKTLQNYIEYLKKANMGQLVNGFLWPRDISNELLEMLKYVRTREEAILASPDPILLDSLNTVAGAGFTPQALFVQSCRLEKCLNNNQIADHQITAVTNQITTWGAQLYEKLGEMILEAGNEEELVKQFQLAFVPSECHDLEIMTLVYERLKEALKILQKTQFLTEFYTKNALYQKYEFTYEYLQDVKDDPDLTVETRAVIEHLNDYIPIKAYQPCQQKRAALVSDPLNPLTVQEVFASLKSWAKKAWRQHKDQDDITELYNELTNMLEQDQNNLEAWEKIEALDSDKPGKKAAHEIFAYRYATGNPNADPHEILKRLKPTAAAPLEPVNIVVEPSNARLISLSEFLNSSENPEKEGDDYLLPHPSFTPGADGAGMVRPGNPLAASLAYLPSLTELFCDDDLILRKTPTKSDSKY